MLGSSFGRFETVEEIGTISCPFDSCTGEKQKPRSLKVGEPFDARPERLTENSLRQSKITQSSRLPNRC